MFCTSLRRRPSFAAAVSSLRALPLGLRESQLDTHDLEVPLNPGRALRVLLFSPSCVSESNLSATKQRMEHFVALTGGQDIIMVFLLNPPAATTFTSARTIAGNAYASDLASMEGTYAYTKLQAEMINLAGLPHVPLLPLHTAEGLSQLLKRHVEVTKRTLPPAGTSVTPFELLQLCAANPPMSLQTAHIVSDVFASLKELARACSNDVLVPSSSLGAISLSSQATATSGWQSTMDVEDSNCNCSGKLQRLRDLLGDEECRNIVEFWKEEWIVD